MLKKTISAEIIADSKNEFGNRITTFVVTFPRIILAELNTHRALSRNSASSRAIPFNKMVKMCQEDPFIPIAWQKDHKGMQGTEYFTDQKDLNLCESHWLIARDMAVEKANDLNKVRLTKQLCNRLLEPFMWHTAIITATELENFFALRCPQYEFVNRAGFKEQRRSKKDFVSYHQVLGDPSPKCLAFDDLDWLKINKGQGEIHIMALAEAMWDAYNESNPKELKAGEWHIPFGDKMDNTKILSIVDNFNVLEEKQIIELDKAKIKIATARCARVSYLNFDGTDDYDKDIKLHDNLAKMGHWSPFEHCAKAMTEDEYFNEYDLKIGRGTSPVCGVSGNLKGFIQYRKTFRDENIT